ncbi:unnamed protein product [Hydatigera taeniaeformis]|uniref:Uncharacterized protein n=1 Tax=Hydatigena taeniaeformis TaxID=6205 RepID=A0A3P7FC41_HYDTA|nr:unnamed protein product [Hydatigera taeniaeformis]
MIAPGLSCSFLVKLVSSDLQDDVCETLRIFYRPEEEPLKVRIFAKREEEYINLTLVPQVVDMGLCLVNSSLSKMVPFNLFSQKRARIFLCPDFDGVFDVSPSEFELVHEMATEAQIKFRPVVSGEFQTTIQVESENRHVGEIMCHGTMCLG